MSNFVGKRPNPLAFAIQKISQTLSGQGKTTGTGAIKKVQPGTKLKFKRGEQDKFIKFRDNLYKSAKFDTTTKNKLKSKQPLTKINKGKSDIFTPKEPKFSKGGRVGLKDGTNLGMQSVKYGLDNNPNITAADPKAKFIAKNKSKKNMKKVAKTPMAKAVRKA